MQDPGNMELTSMDITGAQREKLRQLFPEVFTEGDKIDFDRLKLTLGEMVDTGKEWFGLVWPGKADCFRTIQAPSRATLCPCLGESVDFDTTSNLIIDGDNLEVLKLLQKSCLGKVKMIYIDPPYNTGNDFIYSDNYADSLDNYLWYTGQVDSNRRKFTTNNEVEGRFHSRWLNMVYLRLFLARNMLSDDGVIFISIDDNEVSNLRRVCDEIFGEESFLSCILWQKRTSLDARTALGAAHDYILCYVKVPTDKKSPLNLIPLSEERASSFSNPDNDPRGDWVSVDLTGQTGHATESQFYEITTPGGIKYGPPEGRCWALAEATYRKLAVEGRIWFGSDGTSRPRLKQYRSETSGMTMWTWWTNHEVGHNQEATKDLNELFEKPDVFTNPKPTRLIKRMLELATDSKMEHVVLDFFAGSGTTAQAVLELNNQDGGNRRFILVQLPEPTGRQDFPTIADICKERIRRVIAKLNKEDAGKLPLGGIGGQDRGFRVYKLAPSNFKAWNAERSESQEQLARQLELHIDHILPGRTQEDILTELLLKSGFPLTAKVEKPGLAGRTVYSVAEGALLVCLEFDLSREVIDAMADLKPERVICLDAGFAGNDQLKTNAALAFKDKGVVRFQTV